MCVCVCVCVCVFSYIGGPCSLSYPRPKDVRSQKCRCFCPLGLTSHSGCLIGHVRYYVTIHVFSCNQYLEATATRFHYTLQSSSSPETSSAARTSVDEVLICLSSAAINGFIVYRNVRESVVLHLPSRARARLRPSIGTSSRCRLGITTIQEKYGRARR